MKTLQQIFDATIATGIYGTETKLMCRALYLAHTNKDVITWEEYKKAKKAIDLYITGEAMLLAWLYNNRERLPKSYTNLVKSENRKNNFAATLAIYSNWDKRPRLKPLKQKGN